MKEHPIIFSAESVRAILENRKTQTRRVIKERYQLCNSPEDEPEKFIRWCPYGYIGDELWVKETAKFRSVIRARDKRSIAGFDLHYRADDSVVDFRLHDYKPYQFIKFTPSIYMPRWASRITLQITDVRVERVQGITDCDARAEGCYSYPENYQSAIDEFKALWDSINAKRGYSWESNPWVWVLDFIVKEVYG